CRAASAGSIPFSRPAARRSWRRRRTFSTLASQARLNSIGTVGWASDKPAMRAGGDASDDAEAADCANVVAGQSITATQSVAVATTLAMLQRPSRADGQSRMARSFAGTAQLHAARFDCELWRLSSGEKHRAE